MEQISPQLSVTSFYAYEGVVRTLILRAKVDQCWIAAGILQKILLKKYSENATHFENCTVMAAPSSFWSRVRGKIDLADFLGRELAKSTGTDFLPPPRHLGWHTKKQSFRKFSAVKRFPRAQKIMLRGISIFKVYFQKRVNKKTLDCHNLLLLDDIFTTGSTLLTLRDGLPKSACVQALCFAKTPRKPNEELLK